MCPFRGVLSSSNCEQEEVQEFVVRGTTVHSAFMMKKGELDRYTFCVVASVYSGTDTLIHTS